jgi:hypothetical protein
VEAYPFTLILHMRGRQKRATVTGDMSGIERSSINFCRAPLQHVVAALEIAVR